MSAVPDDDGHVPAGDGSGAADADAPEQKAPGQDRADLAEPSASDILGEALGRAARRAGLDPAEQAGTAHVVWRAMGGWRGILESVLPTLVFVVVWTVSFDATTKQGNLWLAVGSSVGLALLFTLARAVTRSTIAPALGGLIASAAAAALALWTGRSADNFVIGLVTNGAYGTALLLSAVVGWPLIGLAVGWLMSDGTAWRSDRRKRRVFFWLTIAWAALFGVRLAVELPLFLADETALLGTFKLILGLPLFAPMVAVTWLAVRGLYPPAASRASASGGDAAR